MNLNRPIFTFRANWAAALNRSVTFELRPEDIGFGAKYFTPTQSWTVNAWTFAVTLPDAASIAAFDAFTTSLVGRLNGFWLPIPVAAAQITAGTSTTVFSVAAASLSAFWSDRPDTLLRFTFADGTTAVGQIQSVVAAGAVETVTLTSALPQIPDATTTICKLHYVRLASDDEEGDFFAEGGMTRKVSVVELPTEYTAVQTGQQPIYLFHFWTNAPAAENWLYTSFAAPVVSQNQLYKNFPLNFSGLANVSDGSSDDLKIEAQPDPTHPFALFTPVPFSSTLYVEIFAVDYSTPNVQTMLFSGRVVQVEDGGSKLTATCESRLGFLKRKLPRYLKGQTCQNNLYDPETCKLGRAFFETTVSIVSLNAGVFPPTVTCTFLLSAFATQFQATNFLVGGQIETGAGSNYEARTILASSYVGGQLVLTLNIPLVRAQVGANAQIVAGCDHTETTCQLKKNYQNFNGFVAIPDRNPTLKAVNSNPVSQGGK
jgi:hypothetical protein